MFDVIGGGLWRRGSAGWKWARKHLLPHKHKPHPNPQPTPMRPILGCDYVAGPSPALLKTADVRFVGRYISTPGNPKNLTLAEKNALHASGIEIVVIFETTGQTALGGTKAARSDAALAAEAIRQLAIPKDVAIYFAVDYDATDYDPSQPESKTTARKKLGPVANYFAALNEELAGRPVGGYGGFYTIERLFDAGLIAYGMQAYAWSGGRWDGRAHIEQYQNGARIGGSNVDLDRAVQAHFGQWAPGA